MSLSSFCVVMNALRLNYVRLYGESEKNPEKRLNDKDKKRKTNYMYYTNQEWGNATNYDICLDTSRLGVDKCAEIICNIVKNS